MEKVLIFDPEDIIAILRDHADIGEESIKNAVRSYAPLDYPYADLSTLRFHPKTSMLIADLREENQKSEIKNQK